MKALGVVVVVLVMLQRYGVAEGGLRKHKKKVLEVPLLVMVMVLVQRRN